MEVRLGGAWRAAADRESRLVACARALQEELDGVQCILRASEQDRLAKDAKIKLLELKVGWERLVNYSRRKCLDETRLGLARQQQQNKSLSEKQRLLENKAAQLETRLVESDRLYRDVREKLGRVEEELELANRECSIVQEQYDRVEERAEKAENRAREQTQKSATLAKAKQQKENYVCILVKERDRVQRELVELQSKLSKRRVARTTGFGVCENADPNRMKVEKLASNEREKMAKFSASCKLKNELSQEIALRKSAQAQVSRLENEIRSLKIRYRNK
mmetsp:Transcript_8371/g.13562  ORF Transcript_8371/g.13562 Transcript_8371/m.13562 type:complete len:278 (-) Transcript_8371:1765-2598(-)